MNELRQLWVSLPGKTVLAVVFLAWCALFHAAGNSTFGYVNSESLFGWLTGWYRLTSIGESGDELCPYIPFLVLALLYLKREELQSIPKKPFAPALVVVAAGLTLHVVGFVGQQVRISAVGFILGTWGLMGLFWGAAWMRTTVFPWFLLIFAIPLAAYLDSITFHLRLFSTRVAAGICNEVLGLKLLRLGTTVFHLPTATTTGFQFDVAPACSGIRSASVVLLLTIIYAFLNFRSTWRRAVIILCSVPLAVVGNVVRLVVVFVVGEAMGEKAGKLIEQKFGFVTYLGALAGIFLLGWLLREKRSRMPPTPPEAGATPETSLA